MKEYITKKEYDEIVNEKQKFKNLYKKKKDLKIYLKY